MKRGKVWKTKSITFNNYQKCRSRASKMGGLRSVVTGIGYGCHRGQPSKSVVSRECGKIIGCPKCFCCSAVRAVRGCLQRMRDAGRVSKLSKMFVKLKMVVLNDSPKARSGKKREKWKARKVMKTLCSTALQMLGIGCPE